MGEEPLPSLEVLAERIEAARPKPAKYRPRYDERGMGLVFRLVAEFLGCVAVASGIGYALDHGFGWFPWLTIICLFFGLAAGVITLYRTAQDLSQKSTSANLPIK